MAYNKTWKLGEVCKGGVISVSITGKTIVVMGKDWDTSKGWSTASDQSNAKEFTRLTVSADDRDVRRELDDFLNDLTSSYHGGNVLEWIESKVAFTNNSW